MGLCERNGMDNCLYVPGPNRLFELSWLDDTKGRTFEVICNAVWPDGTPYHALPRNVLLSQVHRYLFCLFSYAITDLFISNLLIDSAR